MTCDHTCPDCEKKSADTKALITKLDSYLSLLRHRHIMRSTPDDLIREVDAAIGAARDVTEPRKRAP